MRSHLISQSSRRRVPAPRDLSELITIERQEFGTDERPTGRYTIRQSGVPARLYQSGGDQIYTDDTLRVEATHFFQIRWTFVDDKDRIVWDRKEMDIHAIIDLVPRRWLQLNCRETGRRQIVDAAVDWPGVGPVQWPGFMGGVHWPGVEGVAVDA